VILFLNRSPPRVTYTLSLHDALPISWKSVPAAVPVPSEGLNNLSVEKRAWPSRRDGAACSRPRRRSPPTGRKTMRWGSSGAAGRSEEHTSELQSRGHLVCRLLLEKKK